MFVCFGGGGGGGIGIFRGGSSKDLYNQHRVKVQNNSQPFKIWTSSSSLSARELNAGQRSDAAEHHVDTGEADFCPFGYKMSCLKIEHQI